MVKNPPGNAEDERDLVPYLGQEDPLEKGMTTHSSILLGKSHGWREQPSELQSMWSQKVGHNGVTNTFQAYVCVLHFAFLT